MKKLIIVGLIAGCVLWGKFEWTSTTVPVPVTCAAYGSLNGIIVRVPIMRPPPSLPPEYYEMLH